jgi:hypothetical protein
MPFMPGLKHRRPGSLLDNTPLESFLERAIPIDDVRATSGVPHLLASSAIPFVFAPSAIDAEYFSDGAVRHSMRCSPARAEPAAFLRRQARATSTRQS